MSFNGFMLIFYLVYELVTFKIYPNFLFCPNWLPVFNNSDIISILFSQVDAKLLADIKSLFAVGISETTSKLTINGKNFLIIAADEKEIVGKCGGSAGLTIAKATKCKFYTLSGKKH